MLAAALPCCAFIFGSVLLPTSAYAAAPASANAGADAHAGAGEDREYLPREIVVTGQADRYLEDDGSTATKTRTPLIDVPQSVIIISRHQLEDQAITQLDEALRYVPGITLESGEGHRNEIFIRGQETSADFYLDGLRDDAQYYRSLYNIERIEVLKGANALIFGRGGGGGVVNRVSKIAQLEHDNRQFTWSGDSYSALTATADLNQPLGEGAALRLNTAYEEFDNQRDFYEGRFIGFSPSITAKLGDDTQATLHYIFDDDRRVTDRGIPSLNGAPLPGYAQAFFGVPGFNQARSKVHIARGRIVHDLSDHLSANASVQYAHYDKIYANVLPRSSDGQIVTLSGYEDTTERGNFIAQANLIWNIQTGALRHKVLSGIEATSQNTQNARRNAVLSQSIAPLARVIDFPTVSLTPLVRQRDSQLSVFSAYIQDQIEIGEHVELTAGLRWERFDLDTADLLAIAPNDGRGSRADTLLSPRFGVVYKADNTLSFYGSYSQSYLPQAGDQFLILSAANSGLEPEKFTNYEVGAKWMVQTNLFLTAAIFQLDRTNTRAADPANSGLSVLLGESQTKGLEFNLVGDILPGWSANIGYSYMDGEITRSSHFADAGTRLQQLPKHQFSAWSHVDVTDRFAMGLGAIYRDAQFTSFSGDVILPDYWRFDAAAYYTLSEDASLQINIENLFDATYFPSAHGDNNIQPGDGFTARFGVRFSL